LPSPPPCRHRRPLATPPGAKKGNASSASATTPNPAAAQLTGAIVAFFKDGSSSGGSSPQYGVVTGPDGKAKLAIAAWPTGNRASLPAKSLSLAVAGSFKPSDLDAMLGAGGAGGAGAGAHVADDDEDDLLQLAWEVAVDERGGAGVAIPLPELAELIFGASTARELVRAYDLLSDPRRTGGRYFSAAKAGAAVDRGSSSSSSTTTTIVPPPAFAARTAEAVAAARAAAEAEAEARREERAFVVAVEQARSRRRAAGGAAAAAAGTREAWAEWLGGGGSGDGSSSSSSSTTPAFAARIRALRALALWAPTGEAPQPPREQQPQHQQQQQGLSAALTATLMAGPPLPPPPRGLAAPEDDLSPALPLGCRGGHGGDDNKALYAPALLDLGRRTVTLFGEGGAGSAAAATTAPSASPSSSNNNNSNSNSNSNSLQAVAAASNAAWRLLIDLGLARPHEPRPLLAAGVDPRRPFSPQLEQAAAALAAAAPRLPDPHAARRVPFGGAELEDVAGELRASSATSSRLLRVFAIDDAETLDVDDAISAEPVAGNEGRVRVWVHVADPTRWLLPAAMLDDDAEEGEARRLIDLSRALLSMDGEAAAAAGSAAGSAAEAAGGGEHSHHPRLSLRAAARSLLAEARRRTRSLYLPFGSVPMLPQLLSAGLFSLVPSEDAVEAARALSADAAAAVAAQDRCALSFGAVLDEDGGVVPGSVCIVPSVVRVTDRMTYDQADEALAVGAAAAFAQGGGGGGAGAGGGLDEGGQQHQMQDRDAALQLLYAASRRRRESRDSQGAITIDTPETKLIVAEEDLALAGGGGGGGGNGSNGGNAPRVSATRLSQWESAARQLVAEAMILAGGCAGMVGASSSSSSSPLPLPYRSQARPADLPSPSELDALPPGPCRGYALRRRMTRSALAARPSPHAALGLREYVQVTSPIRRYGDLVAHAALKGGWWGGKPRGRAEAAHAREEEEEEEEEAAATGAIATPPLFDAGALTSALAEQSASAEPLGRAERDVERYWRAEWARQRRAEDAPLDAFVLGWFGSGGQRSGGGGGGGNNNNSGGGGLAALSLDESGLEAVARVWWPARAGERVQALVEEARPGRGGVWRVAVTGPLGGGGEDGEGGGGGGLMVVVEEVGGGRFRGEDATRGFLDGDGEDDDDDDEEEDQEDEYEDEAEPEEEEEEDEDDAATTTTTMAAMA
jgi:exoribonuclease R